MVEISRRFCRSPGVSLGADGIDWGASAHRVPPGGGSNDLRGLGLDPTAYRITCVPFDVYNRLADRCGWGTQRLWTHFDGYQVTRELKLQALVGGDVQYGGADDLCGVGRGYDSEHITARFALVRRDRFEAREPGHQD